MSECIARQPIFDTKLRIYAYELLYRHKAADGDAGMLSDPDKATSQVLANSMFLFGMEKITQGKPAFVNFSRRMLISDVMSFLPQKEIAVEILETVELDEVVLAACKKLKEQGYKIILDDFVYHPRLKPLINMADVIKIDFLASSPSYCEAITKQFPRNKELVFLAEKVETHEQYRQALAWGYTLFQGYFFCKPLVMDANNIQGNRLVYYKLLAALHDPDANLNQIEDIIHKDVSLTYKILKYINSASFSLREKVSSIKQAVALLGNKNLAKFVTLVLLTGLGQDKPGELITTAIIRGRFAELIAEAAGPKDQAGDAFLVGMFSLVDALLDRPMAKILAELPLNDNISEALRLRPGKLTSILEMIIAYEQGYWDKYDFCRQAVNLDDETAKELYMEAIEWAWNIEK